MILTDSSILWRCSSVRWNYTETEDGKSKEEREGGRRVGGRMDCETDPIEITMNLKDR